MKSGCDHAIEYIYHYLDQEITWSRRLRVRWHLRRCTECCDGFDFERRLIQVVRTKGVDEPPPELIDRLRTFINENATEEPET